MENKEEWRDVKGYEGIYRISSLGRVLSIRSNKCLKPNNSGRRTLHQKVKLQVDCISKDVFVHRLVAEAFIPNPNNLPMVNHKDENPLNNRVDNLEWCDDSYNVTYGHSQEKKAMTNVLRGNGNARRRTAQFNKEGELIAVYESTREAEQVTGFACSHIVACCRGQRKSAYHYIWKYI